MKRFWKQVSVVETEDGWRVLLDGRAIKTVAGRAQVVPTQELAQAMAQEWVAQDEEIDPGLFVFRDLADFAIDVVGPERDSQISDILRYGETDTLCYRGEAGEPLADRQLDVWEPLLEAAERRYDVRFERVAGILHRPQPETTLQRLRTVLETHDDFGLSAIKTMANLAASLTVALAALREDADITNLWDAANLEEDWQAELWGKDAEAMDRRQKRLAQFTAAAQFARLSGHRS